MIEEQEEPKYFREAGPYCMRKKRPFRLVIKTYRAEYAIFKIFDDDLEPKEEYVMAHSMAGCGKGFDILEDAFNKTHNNMSNNTLEEEEEEN